MKMIEVTNLRKEYGDLVALNEISFSVNKGSIFGVLGPNGAGKTTCINILTTMIGKTSGVALVGGFDVFKEQDQVRQLIGIVFQESVLDEELSAYENLVIHGKLYRMKDNINQRIDELLKLVELTDSKNVLVRKFSGGMKRRLELARSLMHYPKLLILDEPTTGLDAQTRNKIWDYIVEINKKYETTVVLTTHYLEEAEICDNIVILDEGIIKAYGSVDSIIDNNSSFSLKITVDNVERSIKQLGLNNINDYAVFDNIIEFVDVVDISQLVDKIYRKTDIIITDIQIKRASLENAYLNITGRGIRDTHEEDLK